MLINPPACDIQPSRGNSDWRSANGIMPRDGLIAEIVAYYNIPGEIREDRELKAMR